jgi:hypothetical protein
MAAPRSTMGAPALGYFLRAMDATLPGIKWGRWENMLPHKHQLKGYYKGRPVIVHIEDERRLGEIFAVDVFVPVTGAEFSPSVAFHTDRRGTITWCCLRHHQHTNVASEAVILSAVLATFSAMVSLSFVIRDFCFPGHET